MKKIAVFSLISLLFLSCSKKDDNNSNCNFLQNVGVNTSLNLNLPQYNDLNFISNPIYISGQGNGGLIVTNTGTGFVALDAADPNHMLNTCSILTISGLEGICGCVDANKFSLFTGQPLENPDLRCGLKAYRAELSGNILIIN
jgi:nitrite reductase/ring-hydroxylating ferredoxin subunit